MEVDKYALLYGNLGADDTWLRAQHEVELERVFALLCTSLYMYSRLVPRQEGISILIMSYSTIKDAYHSIDLSSKPLSVRTKWNHFTGR